MSTRVYVFGTTADGRIRAPHQIFPSLAPSITPSQAPGATSFDETVHGDVRVAFHGWTQTLLHTARGLLSLRGDGGADMFKVADMERAEDVEGDIRVVAQLDCPAAVLRGGRVLVCAMGGQGGTTGSELQGPPELPEGRAAMWDDVAATDVGPVLAYRANDGVYVYPTLSALTSSAPGVKLAHPLLRPPISLAATESRAILLAGREVLEAKWDWRRFSSTSPSAPSTSTQPAVEACVPRLEVVDELMGLGVHRVVAGRGNRFAALTEAGEAYVLEPGRGGDGEVKGVRVRAVEQSRGEEDGGEEDGGEEDGGEEDGGEEDGGEEDGDEEGQEQDNDDDEDNEHDHHDEDEEDAITDIALGPDFELVIKAGELWVRGNNIFGQLGQGHTRAVKGWMRVPLPGPPRRVYAARFSAVAEIETQRTVL